jgi:hypothetical protein
MSPDLDAHPWIDRANLKIRCATETQTRMDVDAFHLITGNIYLLGFV